jgi:transposase
VAKAGLDVHVLPAGEAFAVGRDAAGIDALIERLRPLVPAMDAVQATGGLESMVAASLGAAGLPVVVVDPAQVRVFAQARDRGIGASAPSPIRSMPRSLEAVIAKLAVASKPTIRPLTEAETTALADRIAAAGRSCR